ncbi:hypothetical protein CR513_30943, partial [Mucuna pruriens]
MVITIEVANFTIIKVLIDQGNSIDILYMSTFRHLQIIEIEIRPDHEQLVGFLGEHVDTSGYIDLLMTFNDSSTLCTISVQYLIVATDTSYNVLIGQPALNALDTIVSTCHLVMKFPSSNGQVVTIKANQKMARQCYVDSLRVSTKPSKEGNISTHVKISTDVKLDPQPPIDQGAKPIEKLEYIPLTDEEHHT